MKSPPQQPSESVRKLNPHLYSGPQSNSVVKKVSEQPKRIRQSTKLLLNKLEMEWASVLHQRYGQFGFPVFPQAIRFELANGVWYKPDFVVFGETGMLAFECKGPHAFRGGFENLKVAARRFFPRMRWYLVWRKDGEWKQQDVLA